MRSYIHASDTESILRRIQPSAGPLLRLRLLHAEDEDYQAVQPLPAGVVPRGHAHDVYHLCLYTGGQSRFVFREGLHACRKGTLVVTAPGEFHDFRPHGEGSATTLEFTFVVESDAPQEAGPRPFRALLSACVGARLPPVEWPVALTVRQHHQAEFLLDSLLVRLAMRDALLPFDAERMVLDVFRFLAHEVYGVGDARSDTSDPLVHAKAEIEARFHERLRLPELARTAGMSTGHFSRAFRARHGVPPMAYQLALRVRSAKTLLCFGAMPVGEIARRVGFPDIYTFSRMFRRSEGVSPRTYRTGATQATGTSPAPDSARRSQSDD